MHGRQVSATGPGRVGAAGTNEVVLGMIFLMMARLFDTHAGALQELIPFYKLSLQKCGHFPEHYLRRFRSGGAISDYAGRIWFR